ATDHRPAVQRVVEPDQVSGRTVEKARDLLGCELKHLLRVAGRRDQGGDPSQRSLFAGQVAQIPLRTVSIRDVLADAGGADDLALGVAGDSVAPGDLPSFTAPGGQLRLVVNADPVFANAIEELRVTAWEPLHPDRAQQLLALPASHVGQVLVAEDDAALLVDTDGQQLDVL